MIDSSGMFSCVTDYGNYAYKWDQFGPDIRKFLCGLDNSYLCGKLNSRREYDGEATYRYLCKWVLESRRDGSMDRDQARHEWDLIKCVRGNSDHDFSAWYDKTDYPDHEAAIYSLNSDVVAFAEKIYPRLVELMKRDLALPKPPPQCRRCSECIGEEHHWVACASEFFVPMGESEDDAIHLVPCKHCDVMRPWGDSDE